MKLLELDLRAFGPFTGRKLDFSSAPDALHVIYGPNEAGKSTALRAVRGLLYGIPSKTGDAHLHQPSNLRIGAVLGGPGEERLEVVRRKGLRNTLLDADGGPLDEALLARLCGGVSEAVFTTMFGLDHVTLREGGQALLEGGGEIGQSLFGAALGGRGLHRLLRQLREEADALFTPQATKKPLNEALRIHAEAVRNVQDPTTAEAWRNQKEAIDEVRQEIERRRGELQDLRKDERRLLRLKTVLPMLVDRASFEARRRALGDVVRLAAEAGRDRQEAQRRRDEALVQVRSLGEELAAREAERARLVVPENMPPRADLDTRLAELDRLRTLHEKVATELPRLHGEHGRTEALARAVMRRVGGRALGALLAERSPSTASGNRSAARSSRASGALDLEALPLAELDRARPDAGLSARLRRLAESHALAAARRDRSAGEIGATVARRRVIEQRLATLPAARDRRALALAIAAADRQGDLEARVRTASEQGARLSRAARAEFAALGLSGGIDEAAGAPVPTRDVVRRFEKRLADLLSSEQRHVEALRLANERRNTLGVEVDALQRGQAVPTETDLDAARARRDRAWAAIKTALGGGKGRGKKRTAPPEQTMLPVDDLAPAALEAPLPNLGDFEGALRSADEVSDRLRREAVRVSGLARLLADQEANARELGALVIQGEQLATARTALLTEWPERWAEVGAEPPTIGDAAAWLGRHGRLADVAAELASANGEAARLQAMLVERRAALQAALAEIGLADAVPAAADLGALLDRARHELEEIDSTARTRGDGERDLTQLDEERARLERELSTAETALEAWGRDWAEATAALGLPADASPEEATAILQELAELFPLVDEARSLERRAEEMAATAAGYGDLIRRLAEVHAPDLSALAQSAEGAGAAAGELSSRWHRAKTDAVKAEQLDRQIEDKRALLRDARERADIARARIASLLEAAGTDDERELVRIEQRSVEADELDRKLASNQESLTTAAPGFGLDALRAETTGLDVDAVETELDELEARIEETDRAREQAQRNLGGREEGLRELETRSRTADAAAHAEQCLARVRELAERWSRLRLAGAVLAREMEAYRQKNQGPVLARASELFARLTLGSFAGLRVGYGDDDRAVLRCVRAPKAAGPGASEATASAGLEATAGAGEAATSVGSHAVGANGHGAANGSALGEPATGTEVGVEALSDGTRDQLYLALRIASLERHATLAGDTMPLVVDDILVHFDDDRARASLAALGELADKTQVLFFTHHQRLVELAREAVPPGRLVEHRLEAREAARAVAPAPVGE